MKVLIAVDDEIGDDLINVAAQHEWPASCEFRVVHVIPPVMDYVSLAAVPELISDLRLESQRNADSLVQKLRLKLQEHLNSSNVDELVLEGQPADEILSLAKTWHADLILIGSHGRGAIGRIVLGSVSNHVVSESACSTLVVKPTKSAA